MQKSQEEYGLEKYDRDLHLTQYTNTSLSDSIPFSYFEVNRSEFSIIKNDDCHEKECAQDDIFISKKVASPQHLAIHNRNQLPLLTYDYFQSFICSSFGQRFYLQAENEAKNDSFINNDLEQEQVYEQQRTDLDAGELEENVNNEDKKNV